MRGNIEAIFIILVFVVYSVLFYQIVFTDMRRDYVALKNRIFAYIVLNYYTFNETLLHRYYELSDLAYLKVVEYPGGIVLFERGDSGNCVFIRFVFIRSSLNYTVFELGVRP